jgi:SAM-dependent methyltransferase
MLHDKPFQAPLASPGSMLDVGCGTGEMTLGFAKSFPLAAEIIGVDLSPVPQRNTPDQVTFIQGEFRSLVSSGHPKLLPKSFDYIFSRMLVFGMTDWPGYIKQAFELLAPGGWLELQEIHTVYHDEKKQLLSGSWTWLQEQSDAWAQRGLDIHCGPKLEGYMRSAGLQDVHVKRFRWMFGPGHPQTDLIPSYTTRHLFDANFGAYKKIVGPRKSAQELAEVETRMREDMSYSEDGKHCEFFVVYGRKT